MQTRVASSAPTLIVFVSRVLADRRARAVRAGDEGFVIDSPVFPDELEALPERARAGRLPGRRGCWPPTPTGITCSGRLAFPGARSAAARAPRARLTAEPGARPARAAASSTRSTTSSGRAAAVAGGLQSLPVPGKLALGPASQRARAAPGRRATRPTATAFLMPVARRAGVRRLPVAGRDPDGSPREARSTAYLATLERLRELVGRAADRRPRPRRARSRAERRSRSSTRTSAYLDALAQRGRAGAAARRAGATAAQRRSTSATRSGRSLLATPS